MIKAFIPSYQCVEIRGRNKKYHTYRIEIHSPQHDDVFYLDRRYSDFLQLHKQVTLPNTYCLIVLCLDQLIFDYHEFLWLFQLRKQFGSEVPCFPPKKVRNSSVKVLESRRTSLELYLQTMLTFNPVPPQVLSFLNLHSRCFKPSSPSIYSDFPSESTLNNPAAGFLEDPFIESDTSSNLSDTVTRGVLDALYNI